MGRQGNCHLPRSIGRSSFVRNPDKINGWDPSKLKYHTLDSSQRSPHTFESDTFRRLRAQTIAVALQEQESRSELAFDFDEDVDQDIETDVLPDITFDDCPRYKWILRGLNQYQEALALDTMTFWMPEHTMYSHLIRIVPQFKDLELSPEETRDFVIACANANKFFK